MDRFIDVKSQPLAVRKRAREIFLEMDSIVQKNWDDMPTVQVMMTPKLCKCGCGGKVSRKSNSRYRPGHFIRLKWQMAFAQAIHEFEEQS